MEHFDLVVIGAGPAGYVAAIRASQLGLKTACIDGWINKDNQPALGGTCLNVGCIPSKALLDSSEQYYRMVHHIGSHGIEVGDIRLNIPAMIGRKDDIVKKLTGGIEGLFRKNKVTWLKGVGRLLPENRVEIQARHDGHQAGMVEAEHIIIATGSSPRDIPLLPIDGNRIVDSTGALAFDEVPPRLGIIGAGVIGLEMGSVWNRLGSEVTILEATQDFLFFADRQVADEAYQAFTKDQGLAVRLGARVRTAEVTDAGVTVSFDDAEGSHTLDVDRLVVAVGRKPNTSELNADAVALYLDEGGYINVDEFCRTNLPNVYAVGDVVRGPMLAHKGSEEGVMVAERLAGHHTHVNYDTIPWVVYTSPEMAWVGRTEQQLEAESVAFKSGVFPLRANGRALAMEQQTGFVKVLADAATDEILGVHIVGVFASELIAEAVVAMEYKASAEDLARTVHAHPTISEALHEAALAVDGRPLHV